MDNFGIDTLYEFLGEVVGTALILICGAGVCASVTFGDALVAPGAGGDFFSINVGWGFGVFLGAMFAMKPSGAHLNPAVSTSFALTGKFPAWKLGHYFAGQYLGAFIGAALVYAVYLEAFNEYHTNVGEWSDTMGIFSTYPQSWISIGMGFFEECFGTALLLMGLSYAADASNKHSGVTIASIASFLVVGVGVIFGMQCGYAINPARDFGPRLFTCIAGWGSQVWTANNYWFWVPVVAPHVGGAVGAGLYWIIVDRGLGSKTSTIELEVDPKISVKDQNSDESSASIV